MLKFIFALSLFATVGCALIPKESVDYCADEMAIRKVKYSQLKTEMNKCLDRIPGEDEPADLE